LLAWCWVIGLLGLGRRHLNFGNRFLSYANEAVLPFYILHQGLIVVIGFFVTQLELGVAAKYFIMVTASFASIMLLYEVLVKRNPVGRFLFGMRLTK